MQKKASNEDEVRSRIAFIQEQLTEYSAFSVVAVALKLLSETKPWTFEDVKAMPGLTLLLVKWAIQNPNCRLYLGKPISRREFDAFRRRVWDLTGKAKAGSANVYAMMRSILPSQVDFQRRSPWGFMRWPALIARLPADHPTRVQFATVLRLTPEEFIDACWILRPPVIEGKLQIDAGWLAGAPPSRRDAVSKVLQMVGKDFFSLRTELTQHSPSHPVSSWEMFESPFAKKYPLLQVGENSWRVWHPAMFERGLEDAVHLCLTHLKSQYTEAFSRVFEQYVVELAKEAWPNLVSEDEWKAVMGHNSSSVEAILPVGPANVFVEAKMSLFHDAALIDDTDEGLSRRLERVVSAVQQGWKVSALLRDRPHLFPRRAEAEEQYLVIVTSRELHVGGGLALKRLLPQGSLDYPGQEAERWLPLQNVFILSVESFERLQQVALQQNGELLGILRAAKAANSDAATSAMYFDDHLKKYTKRWGVPELVRSARDASVSRLKEAFSEAA